METQTIPQIVLAARQGSEQAYQALVSGFGPGLLGYFVRNTGNRSDAEDLLQEVFLRLVKGLKTYTEKERFEVWLYRMAHHLLIDYWRRHKVILGAETWMLEQETMQDAAGHLVTRESDDALQKALAKLPPAQREVILLRYFSGLPFDQIARIHGTPLGTALARAHRGLGKLRELLGDGKDLEENVKLKMQSANIGVVQGSKFRVQG